MADQNPEQNERRKLQTVHSCRKKIEIINATILIE